MQQAILCVRGYKDKARAEQAADLLENQPDFIGLRVLAPTQAKPLWRIQAFFRAPAQDHVLPGGCWRVKLAPAILTQIARSSPLR